MTAPVVWEPASEEAAEKLPLVLPVLRLPVRFRMADLMRFAELVYRL
jgi:hypothetical protein